MAQPIQRCAAMQVLAALKHHFVDRDDVLRRMLAFVRAAPSCGSAVLLLQGSAMFRCLAFDVGRGGWASTEWVADAVTVNFSARFAPVAAP